MPSQNKNPLRNIFKKVDLKLIDFGRSSGKGLWEGPMRLGVGEGGKRKKERKMIQTTKKVMGA